MKKFIAKYYLLFQWSIFFFNGKIYTPLIYLFTNNRNYYNNNNYFMNLKKEIKIIKVIIK